MTTPQALDTVLVPLGDLTEHPENYNHGDDQRLAELLTRWGQWRPAVVQRSTGRVLIGNTMLRAARLLGWTHLNVHYRDDDDDAARRVLAADNRARDLATTDEEALAALLRELDGDLEGTGWVADEFDALLADLDGTGAGARGGGQGAPAPTLAERFLVPPFTVLDGRGGLWMERKRRWLALGIRSELGRGDDHLGMAHLHADDTYGRGPSASPGDGQWQPSETASPDGFLAANDARKRAAGPHPGGGGGGAWKGRGADGRSHPYDPKWQDGALTLGSLSGRVPSYYAQKEQAEARLGHPLTAEEFERDHLDVGGDTANLSTSGTSVFDPVLAELAVRWFSPPAGHVLDPFAGGSVRGIVTTHLGRSYEGNELRAEQVAACEEQRTLAPAGADLVWRQGDATALPADGRTADLLLTCPPYAWLERYSDDPADLSTMGWPAFQQAHRQAIAAALHRLAADRFAVWVVGEVRSRGGDGHSVGLIADTIDAFRAAGAELYNELIYVTPVGSLPVRVGRQFTGARKVGRTHQHILVFVKGDGRAAAAACGPIDVAVEEGQAEGIADAQALAAAAEDEALADAAAPLPDQGGGGAGATG